MASSVVQVNQRDLFLMKSDQKSKMITFKRRNLLLPVFFGGINLYLEHT